MFPPGFHCCFLLVAFFKVGFELKKFSQETRCMTLILGRILNEFWINSGLIEVYDKVPKWQGDHFAVPCCEGHLDSPFSVVPTAASFPDLWSGREDLSWERLLLCVEKYSICTGWRWADNPLPWHKLSFEVNPPLCILLGSPFANGTQSCWCICCRWFHVPACSFECSGSSELCFRGGFQEVWVLATLNITLWGIR